MDAIFKALSDPARRALLDALRRNDGQTLGQLEPVLDMTRFGVMKHLRLLEDAHLITTKKLGRFKYHYLNPVPLQEMVDRWVEPLVARPITRGAIALKTQLQGKTAMTQKPDFIASIFINCTQDALWDALRDPDKWHLFDDYQHRIKQDGDTRVMVLEDGTQSLRTRDLKIDPKTRIETTFEPLWAEDLPTGRVVYQIEPQGAFCKLTIEHYGVEDGLEEVSESWMRTMSGLKTLLETGKPMNFGHVQE